MACDYCSGKKKITGVWICYDGCTWGERGNGSMIATHDQVFCPMCGDFIADEHLLTEYGRSVVEHAKKHGVSVHNAMTALMQAKQL